MNRLAVALWLAVPLAAEKPPSVVSGLPAMAYGSSVTFTFVGRDPDGADDIENMYFLIASSPDIAPGVCHGLYNQSSRFAYLYSDALNIAASVAAFTAGTVHNSQCIVSGGGTGALAAKGADLTLSLSLTLSGDFGAAVRNVYLWVKDKKGRETGWVKTGEWLPAPLLPAPPPVVLSKMYDQYFDIPHSLNNWVTLDHTPAIDTLLLAWFEGASGAQTWTAVRPRLLWTDPKQVEVITSEAGRLLIVYWSYERNP